MQRVLLALTLLLTLTRTSAGQIPVSDAAAAGQRVVQLARQAQQILNDYQMITNQMTSITHQVTNLQRLPSSIVQDVLGIGNQLSGVLRQSQGVSFDLQSSLRQFDALTQMGTGAMTTAQTLALRQQWLAQRQDAARMSMQVTSIGSDLAQRFAQLCALLGQSLSLKGNLDAQQLSQQQQALSQTIALQSQQMQAVRDRLATQDAAEHQVLQRIQLEQMQRAHRDLDTSTPYVTDGKLQDYTTWDK
jgi:P-type conjugative transfer protein TrbJ